MLLNGILHGEYGRELSCLGVQDSSPINILDGEVNILEHLRSFSLCTKARYRDDHSYDDTKKGYDYINSHFSLFVLFSIRIVKGANGRYVRCPFLIG